MKNSIIAVVLTMCIFSPVIYAADLLLNNEEHKSIYEWAYIIGIASCSGVWSGSLIRWLNRSDR